MLTDREYVEIAKLHPFSSRVYEGQEKDREQMINYNKKLCERYPFLIPRDVFTGLVSEDFDYSFSLLDLLPEGWRLAFGVQMVEEIREALLAAQKRNPSGGYPESEYTIKYDSTEVLPYLQGYQPTQIKSKYGSLCWYDNGAPAEVYEIIDKYETLSSMTCEFCGAPAEYLSKGWIDPYCKSCALKNINNPREFENEYIKINDTDKKGNV